MNKNDIKITLTSHPKEKPAPETLLFGREFTDHMFTMDYSPEKGWHDPQIIPYGPFQMDPATMVLHYSQSVFEGMKAYKTPEGKVVLFRPEMNFKRLNISNERLCIPEIDVDFAITALKELIKVDQDWIPTAPGTSLYIRPFTMGMDKSLGVTPSSHCKFAIILSPVGPYYKEGINPVKIYVEDEYVRAVKGGIGFTKATANYAASLKGQQKAMKLGYAQVLWLDGVERKYVEEVGAMNVFFKIDGELITPSLEGSILAGVTRDSVIQIARSMGIKVTERKLSIQEIFEAADSGKLEEAFGSGTAAVITPVGLLTWEDRSITIADGKNGDFTMKVYNELTGIQNGVVEDRFGWIVSVA
ncbi:MAG: branched-chain amino acid aminotransferase [Defluviitaleaceae bacterium]|nr:branched-chain amino acid aminotransferase [Defluviitaleaceae bacterium]